MTKVASFEKARQKRADRFKYTAVNAAPAILDAFDRMQRSTDREQRIRRADHERANRKRI